MTATTDSARTLRDDQYTEVALAPTRRSGLPLAPAPTSLGWSRTANRHRRALVLADSVGALGAAASGAWVLPLLSVDPWWALAPIALVPAAALCGGLRRLRVDRAASCWQGVVKGAVVALLVLFAVTSLVGVAVPPAVTFGLLPLAVAVAVALRVTAARRLADRRRDGLDLQRAVVVGASDTAGEFVLRALRHPEDGIDIIGQVRVPRRQGAGPLPFLGSIGEIHEVVRAHEIDLVVVVGALPAAQTRKLSWALAGTGADLVINPGLAEVGSHRLSVLPTTASWNGGLVVAPRPGDSLVKNLIDRTAGAGMLLVAAPVILGFALAVRLTSPGGSFYSQERVGRHGELFRMWKLRSMYQDADARRAALLQDNECDGIIFKQKNDPRITPVGRFIRRYSIDELPQLWNVVRGDMSLIGPRPALPEEVAQYDDLVARRLLVTPGLTGLWQVSGRSNLSWDRTVELDLRYVDNRTLTMDAKIMAATGRAVFGASGAY